MLALLSLLPLLLPPALAKPHIDTPVLILGAGLTGLTASTLLSSTYNFSQYTLLDSQPRLGGRLYAVPFGSGGPDANGQWVIELGANWVQGLENPDTNLTNPIWTLAQTYNLSTTYSNYSDFLPYSNDGPLDYDIVSNVMNNISDVFYGDFLTIAGERQARNAHDLTARAGLRRAGWDVTVGDYIDMACEFWTFDMEYSQTPDESSWIQIANNNNYTFNDFSGDNNLVVDPRGYATIATAPFYGLPASQRGTVLLNTTVTAIDYSHPEHVTVSLDSGENITASYVLCTFSVGVLQSPDLSWTPALPDWKQDAIDGFAMTSYTKIFFQFPSKFWPDTQFQLYADPAIRGRYTQFQSLDSPGFLEGSKILFTTVVDQDSIRVESMSDDAVKAEILEVLRGMYGEESVPDPTAFYFQRWHADPSFRGTYSNWPAAYPPAMQDNLRAALGGRVLFAGEATSFEYFGFLQGAYTEGLRAGHSIAACLLGSNAGEKGCLGERWWEDVLDGEGVGERFE